MDTVRGAAGVGEPFPVAPHNPLDHQESHAGTCYHPNQPHPVIVDAEVIEDYQPRHADDSETNDQYRLRSERYWEKGFRDQYRARHRQD